MRRIFQASPFLLLAGCLVAADDAAWKDKQVSRWDAKDAQQVLTDSPWAKSVAPQWLRDLSPDERRMGGDLQADRGKGVGLEGLLGIFNEQREQEAIARAHEKPDPGKVLVRWESAGPVRAAEQKLGETDTPELDSDYYAIAVHDIHTPKRWNIENELKGIAKLMRNGKKDLKPARVMILRDDGPGDLATVIYLFPRSQEITKRDGNFRFVAQIGQLFVTEVFSTQDMQIRGELEL